MVSWAVVVVVLVVVGWGWWGCLWGDERRDAARSAMASPRAVRGWVVRLVGSVVELDIVVVVSKSFLVEEDGGVVF